MNQLMLFTAMLCLSMQSIFQKLYNKSNPDGSVSHFTAGAAITALIFFVALSGGRFQFEWRTLVLAAGFALCYLAALVFSTLAVSTGSLSLSSLIISYSLIIPAFYGVAFLHEEIRAVTVIGIALLLASLYLINRGKDEKKVTAKWLLYILVAFLGNGGCASIQKVQQVLCKGDFKYEFMIIALAIVAVVMTVKSVESEGRATKSDLLFSAAYGICNGGVNLLVMILSGRMPAAVMFPIISGGSVLVTYFISRFAFKERLSRIQNMGVALGIISVVVLNL